MDLVTIDFETYYDRKYSLSKITTEEYIRSDEFEVIGVATKLNNGDTEWASGTMKQMKEYLQGLYDWEKVGVIAHNMAFDGAILSWIFDIHPKLLVDTMSMGRALNPATQRVSLKALSELYNLGQKGTEVLDALGKRRLDFSEDELERYGDYCINDVELTWKLFRKMVKYMPVKEMKVIDMTLKMFTEPKLELNRELLSVHLRKVQLQKEDLLTALDLDRKQLTSAKKFADLLRDRGVEPPMKISPRTGKETFAFAKTDQGMLDLQDHEDIEVQALAAAKLGVSSTLEETRTQRFIEIQTRGRLPVPLRYCAAHTTRWGGQDKINLQNLPSRGPNGKILKKSIVAPDGYQIVECDSSQIEARVLAWWAGQDDLLQAFVNKEDVYKIMAAKIYGKDVEDINKDERFVGKTTILGSGYGMGGKAFQGQLKNFGVETELDECKRIIDVYRFSNDAIVQIWREAQKMLRNMVAGKSHQFGREGIVEVDANELGVMLPSGLFVYYPNLQAQQTEKGYQYTYSSMKGPTKIYGGKVIENLCQGIARCVISEQMLMIQKEYPVLFTVHDSVGALVPEDEVEEGQQYIEDCMRWTPKWAKGLPLDCESGYAKSYGDCE